MLDTIKLVIIVLNVIQLQENFLIQLQNNVDHARLEQITIVHLKHAIASQLLLRPQFNVWLLDNLILHLMFVNVQD